MKFQQKSSNAINMYKMENQKPQPYTELTNGERAALK